MLKINSINLYHQFIQSSEKLEIIRTEDIIKLILHRGITEEELIKIAHIPGWKNNNCTFIEIVMKKILDNYKCFSICFTDEQLKQETNSIAIMIHASDNEKDIMAYHNDRDLIVNMIRDDVCYIRCFDVSIGYFRYSHEDENQKTFAEQIQILDDIIHGRKEKYRIRN